MPKIPFTVSARTAQLIGQQNFSSAEGAVIELVKNCYDADSKISIVFFDNADSDFSKHALYIIDIGDGMTEKIIRENWMMIGTDNKEDDYRTASGRVKTGAKGIGRFALDRLGQIAEMYTVPKGENIGSYWMVNWDDFKQKGISISQVNATLEDLPIAEYEVLANKVIAQNLRLLKFIEENNIQFENGTILKISSLNELWEEDEISKLFANLEILIPPLEQPAFKIGLYSRFSPDEFGVLAGAYYDDFDYKLTAKYLDDQERTVQITIERDELDLKKIEASYMDVFSMPLMKNAPYDFETFKRKIYTTSVTLNELVKGQSEVDTKDLLDKIGEFGFSFYYLKNTKGDDKSDGDEKKYPYQDFNSANRRAWLRKFGGIKIFRDDFRVRPYGEYGEDWLKLGERQGRSPQGAGQRIGAYRIRPNQISGTVNISRLTNLSFQDKSGREGLQENEVFDLFKSILKGIIAIFERDRNVIMYSFSELQKKINKAAEERRKAEEEAQRVLDEAEKAAEVERNRAAENPSDNIAGDNSGENPNSEPHAGPTETEKTLAIGFQSQKQEIEEKDNEIRLLRSLSGTGLIVASFAHELRSLRTLLVSRTDDLRLLLEKFIPQKDVKGLPMEENPYTMLNFMRDQDVQIKHWLDYSLSALKKDKRTRTNLNIADYFSAFKASWDNALKRRVVSLRLENNLTSPTAIRAFAIDFDTLFNNFLINSLDSFKRRKDSKPREVTIAYKVEDGLLHITFTDTGAGLSEDFQRNPDDIFVAFETSKVDKRGNKVGTGIGMYLAKTIVEDYRGDIRILEFIDGFKLGITLPLRKDDNE